MSARVCTRACVRVYLTRSFKNQKVFRKLKRKIGNSFQFGGRAPASLFHLLYYLNLICGRGGTRSKQWAADGSGPGCWSRVGGAPSGFTFCVRAAEQVKELGYAHNLRVVLREWPKIWSCDGGRFARFSPSREETEDSARVWAETCWRPTRSPPSPLRRPAKGSSSTVRRDRQKEKSTDDILMLFTGWSVTLLSVFKVSQLLLLLLLFLDRVCVVSVTVAGSVIDACGWVEGVWEDQSVDRGKRTRLS